jgi:hypothetical protein
MFQLREWYFSLDESPDWDCLFEDSIYELAKSPCPSVFQLLNCPEVPMWEVIRRPARSMGLLTRRPWSLRVDLLCK